MTNLKSPFKFLDSYTSEDQDIFFGREQEIEEVYTKLFQSQLLLVYGASGTGKSSIINCGLANKFQDTDWLPVHIRRGGHIMRSTFQQVQASAVHQLKIENESSPDKKDIKKAVSSLFLDHFKPVYLIFDQFEELFIFGYKEEWQSFIEAVKYLIDSDLDVRFIFVIRGEYLEFLSEFENFIPHFFDNRVRVEKMTRNAAKESISGPCDQFNIQREDGFEEVLLKKISPNKAQVELTFLQVYLDKVYHKARENQKGQLQLGLEDIEELGEIGDVLAEFVDEQLFKMPDSKASLTVLKSFVSMEGTKTRMKLADVAGYCSNIGHPLSEEKIEEIILSFVNKRILKEKDENEHYELRHDSLAQKVFEKITYQEKELLDIKHFIDFAFNEYEKRGTLLNDEDLSYIALFERTLNLPDEIQAFIAESKSRSKRRIEAKRTRNGIIVIILILLVTSIAGFVYSQQQKARAEQMATIAEKNALQAMEQSKAAENSSREAATQAELADEQRKKAEASKREADQQRVNALLQKDIAEEEKLIAQQARQSAEQSEKEALAQREIAIREKRLSTRLRMLTLARELAIKTQFIEEPQLKSLLSVLAKKFNDFNDGEPNQPEIYKALYYANRSLIGKDFNEVKYHDLAISDMLIADHQLWTASHDGRIIVSNADGSEPAILFESDDVFETISVVAAIDRMIAGTNSGSIVVLNLNGQVLSRVETDDQVLQIIQYKQNFLVIGESGTMTVLDMQGNISEQVSLNERISSATMLNDQLIIALNDGEIVSLDMESLQEDRRIDLLQPVKSIQVIHDNEVLAIGFEDGQLALFSTYTYSEIIRIKAHSAAITDILFIPEDHRLVTASFDRTAAIWDIKNMRSQPIILDDHDAWVYRLTYDQASKSILTAEFDGNINMYPLDTQSLKEQLCSNLDRQLTPEEWKTFVANDIAYETVCED